VLPTIDSNIINQDEVVTRYLLSSSHYSVNNSRVKPRALEPSPSDQSTSVFRVNGLGENEIWDMGTRLVAAHRVPQLRARADISVSSILELNLSVRPDEPPVRHALIYGWSNEKHALMAKAQELAATAVLKLNP
jgi:hypothetical protein